LKVKFKGHLFDTLEVIEAESRAVLSINIYFGYTVVDFLYLNRRLCFYLKGSFKGWAQPRPQEEIFLSPHRQSLFLSPDSLIIFLDRNSLEKGG
jgi:hypothetical protein